MRVYIYCADLFCERCGEQAVLDLEAEGKDPEIVCPDCKHEGKGATFKPTGSHDWRECPACGSTRCAYDDRDYDSDDFPKGPMDEGESDSPSYCGECGLFLESDLTSEGVAYVRETVREHYLDKGKASATAALRRGVLSPCAAEWKAHYDYIDFNLGDDEGEDDEDEDGVEDVEDDAEEDGVERTTE